MAHRIGCRYELEKIREAAVFTAQRILLGRTPVRTSSLGRLFDAVAFILSVTDVNHHEAQAAMTLESMALEAMEMRLAKSDGAPSKIAEPVQRFSEDRSRYWRCESASTDEHTGLLQTYDVTLLIRELVFRRLSGHDLRELALFFHEVIGDLLVEMVIAVARETEIKRAVLSGGCFINSILSAQVEEGLEKHMDVYTNRQVPAGDGGICSGTGTVCCSDYTEKRCLMCLAIPGKVIAIEESETVAGGQLATVDFDGSRVEVSLTMVPEATLGSWVLVHAGYAIEVLDEEEAGKTWDWLKQADLVEDVPGDLKGHGSDNG